MKNAKGKTILAGWGPVRSNSRSLILVMYAKLCGQLFGSNYRPPRGCMVGKRKPKGRSAHENEKKVVDKSEQALNFIKTGNKL